MVLVVLFRLMFVLQILNKYFCVTGARGKMQGSLDSKIGEMSNLAYLDLSKNRWYYTYLCLYRCLIRIIFQSNLIFQFVYCNYRPMPNAWEWPQRYNWGYSYRNRIDFINGFRHGYVNIFLTKFILDTAENSIMLDFNA